MSNASNNTAAGYNYGDDSNSNSSNGTSKKKKSDKVKTSNDLEQSQNQLKGIEQAQDASKKAVPGQKQHAI